MIRNTFPGMVVISRTTGTGLEDRVGIRVILGDREQIVDVKLTLEEFARAITGQAVDSIEVTHFQKETNYEA